MAGTCSMVTGIEGFVGNMWAIQRKPLILGTVCVLTRVSLITYFQISYSFPCISDFLKTQSVFQRG